MLQSSSHCRASRAAPNFRLGLALGLAGAVLASLLTSPAEAAEDWSLCPAPVSFSAPQLAEGLPAGAIQAYADRLESDAPGSTAQARVVLDGNVLMETWSERLQADYADFSRSTGTMLLRGHVSLENAGMHLFADEGSYNQRSGLGGFSQAQYSLHATRGNGAARHIQRPTPTTTVLDQAIYTSCEVPDPEWALHAGKLTLDETAGRGTAKHLRLHLLGVPVLYWPYISFPIDDRRKSGLLFPRFGNSTDRGFEYIQPIYWNIHPQADATLTPHHMYRRGQQLQTEWRYLNRIGTYQLNAEQLDDKKFGDKRWLVGFQHSGNLGHGWRSSITTRRVSDTEYVEDLDNSLGFAATQHLLSTGSLSYSGEHWRHKLGVDRYQTIDASIPEVSRPHRREPFIYTDADYDWGDYRFTLDSSLIHFVNDAKLNGQRLDLYPSLSRSFGGAGWFSNAKLGLRYTRYALDNLQTTTDKEPSRSTAIASLDSGLIFERSVGQHYTQTLEPRLYGLYVPAREQGQMPLFDTGAYTFNYAQLFRDNRFTGADRQGDAQQLSLGLTTRVIDEHSGEERLSASIGRAYYLADREVTLNETSEDTHTASDLVGDAQWQIDAHWSAAASAQYSREDEEFERRNYRLRYKAAGDKVANLGYRYVRDSSPAAEHTKQAEFSGVWPLGAHWTVVGRWLYDLQDKRSRETFAGFAYQSCCWAVSLVGRRLVEEELVNGLPEQDTDQQWLIQFTLKGLASLGDDNNLLLKRGILGFDNTAE